MKTPTRAKIEKSIGPDDYEEAELLRRLAVLESQVRSRLAMLPSARPKNTSASGATPEDLKEREWLHKKLGYNPDIGRVSRPRGRPRAESIPNPLPPVGTKLLSCLGHEYIIQGYACAPRQLGLPTVVLYTVDGILVARSLPNLFAGRLSNGEPLVTWPEDPRGLKPSTDVPLKYRRTVNRADLVAKKGARTATPLDQQMDLEAEAARKAGRRY